MPRKSGCRLTDWLDITLLVLTGPSNQTSLEIRENNLLETVKVFFKIPGMQTTGSHLCKEDIRGFGNTEDDMKGQE